MHACRIAAVCVDGCGAARHAMPQVLPASGASTSRRMSARASWARRSIAFSVSCSPSGLNLRCGQTIRHLPSSGQARDSGGATGLLRWSVRQMSVAVQQLDRREEEEPETHNCGESAEDEHGDTALIYMIVAGMLLTHFWIDDTAKTHAGAERGHEQECNADNEAGVQHGDDFPSTRKCKKTLVQVDAAGSLAVDAGTLQPR